MTGAGWDSNPTGLAALRIFIPLRLSPPPLALLARAGIALLRVFPTLKISCGSLLSLIREKQPNLFPLKLISSSKRLNFENRTEWVESRGSERNGAFGE
jgi:hypothetical protein